MEVHLILHLVSVSTDLAKASVRHQNSDSQPLPPFNQSKHHHVAEDQYCSLCEVTM